MPVYIWMRSSILAASSMYDSVVRVPIPDLEVVPSPRISFALVGWMSRFFRLCCLAS